jgi:hypothetical protein
MAAVTDPKWDTIPSALKISSYDAATKTLVASEEGDIQSTFNVFLEAFKVVTESDTYIHTATAKAALVDLLILVHIYPKLAFALPLKGSDMQRMGKEALTAVGF